MKTIDECWRAVRRAASAKAPTQGLKAALAVPWSKVDRTAVSVDAKVLKADYLEFLASQVEQCPRGSKWSRVLARRIAALEPHRGRRLVSFTVLVGKRWFWAKVDQGTGKVVHWELD